LFTSSLFFSFTPLLPRATLFPYTTLFRSGDVIVAINGTPVDRADDVVRTVSSLKPKDVAVFTVVRDGHQKKLAVTLGERQLPTRSEEHTSELQSRVDLVCRLLLEKKKINR